MPAIITHSFFADDVFEGMKPSKLKEEITGRRNLFRLGAQGPDIFFYYKGQPWVKYDGIEKLGNIMHDEKVGIFFSESFDYLNKLPRNNKFYDLLSYLVGYLCHYSLDRTAHPFIHYTAGIDADHSRKTRKYHSYHRKLESTIDYFSLLKRGFTPNLFKGYNLIKIGNSDKPVLRDYYKYILNTIYETRINGKQVDSALTDICEVLKYLYDPIGFKFVLYRLIEIVLGKKDEITSSMIPKRINGKFDYLNLGYKAWLHPCDCSKKSKVSFWGLYEEALAEAGKFMDLVSSYTDRGELPGIFMKIIDNISYSTGVKCGNDSKLRYFDSIYERKQDTFH